MPAQRDKHAIKPPTHPCALDRCDLQNASMVGNKLLRMPWIASDAESQPWLRWPDAGEQCTRCAVIGVFYGKRICVIRVTLFAKGKQVPSPRWHVPDTDRSWTL